MRNPIPHFLVGLVAAASSHGAGPHPDISEHHGYTCIATPCTSVSHTGHDFGTAMAPIRLSRVVIGVPDEFFSASTRANAVRTGAVFIYDQFGSVIQTVANPNPESGDKFGAAVAPARKLNAFVVGAPLKDVGLLKDVGAAYVFADTGTLLGTINHPLPTQSGQFGETVARLGNNSVLVGAPETSGGAVWGFSLAGAHQVTHSNPLSSAGDRFGAAITELNPTRIVIGSPGEDTPQPNIGILHNFHPAGGYLGAVTCPIVAADAAFGSSLATLDTNLFAVGAPGIDTVLLFDGGGALVQTIPNPFPGEVEEFGRSLAAVNDERLLIGAAQPNSGGPPTGRAFLYDTAGHRLLDLDIEDLAGSAQPEFGWSVSALGDAGLVVGDPGGDTVEVNAGSAYFYQDLAIVTQTQFGATFDVNIVPHTPQDPICNGTLPCLLPELAVTEVFDSVTWSNQDSVAHRLVSGTPSAGPDGCFDTGVIDAAQAYTQIFDDRITGFLDYYCTFHTGETARVRIDSNETSADALLVGDGVPLTVRFEESGDVEWMKFFATTALVYTVDAVQVGAQVDVVMEVFYQLPNGSLSNVSGIVNLFSTGAGIKETVRLPNPPQGFYFVKLSYIDLGNYGFDTDVEFTTSSESAASPTFFFVHAVDLVTQDVPAGAIATELNTGKSEPFLPGDVTVLYQSLPVGNNPFRVTANPGILPLQSPALPGQVGNAGNATYGNPRTLHVGGPGDPGATVFSFLSTFTVTGRLRNLWTGVDVNNAAISFVATSGLSAGTEYFRYPLDAWYATPWASLPNGNFPGGITLPVANMQLRISHSGYEDYVAPVSIPAPAVNAQVDVGTIFLTPKDENGNMISDYWDNVMAPGCELPANGDKDGDGDTNLKEYYVGTDPLDPNSFFQLDQSMESAGMQLTWPTAAGRNYAVQSYGAPVANWITETGPSPAKVFVAGWLDAGALVETDKLYRIDLTVP